MVHRFGAVLIAFPLLVSCEWIPGTEAHKFEAAKQLVAEKLKDPTSPLFTDLQAASDGVCGQVNAKNGFGAYSGKGRFVVRDGGTVLIEGLESDNSGITATNMCELGHQYSACQSGASLLNASIASFKECDDAGKRAIESQFGLKAGSLPRLGEPKTQK